VFTYTENNAFPTGVGLADDADAPNMTNFNPGHEGALDRTAFLARRLLPAGVTTFWAGPNPSDLTGIVGAANLETRRVAGHGLYVFKSASTSAADGEYVVTGNGGTGRWHSEDYTRMSDRLIQEEQNVTAGAAALTLTLGAGNHLDPGGRHAGTANGYLILQSNTYTSRSGDVFDIAWSATYRLGGNAAIADPVVGVMMSRAGVITWPGGLNERAHQVSADTVNGGSWATGEYVTQATSIAGATTMVHMHRRSRVVATGGAADTTFFELAAALDTTSTGVSAILQGASMCIAQFRPGIA
jgi:hypothetical protein